jgi:hypothetical protein
MASATSFHQPSKSNGACTFEDFNAAMMPSA